ncbi:MAG: putative transporter [Bacteroidales bacterium]|nr:putative transporter [Bacteroidales bacterium]
MADTSWFASLFTTPSAVQAVVVLSLICALGLWLGKINLRGVKLGGAFVFFVGILAGAWGLKIDSHMAEYAENFGLILFVYALGLQVGPGFVMAFRRGGARLSLLALGVVLLGTLLMVGLALILPVSFPAMVGVLCGAVTNTPALGAAQQTMVQMGLGSQSYEPALSTALTYPLGLVGVILAVILLRLWLKHTVSHNVHSSDEAYIASFEVVNPAIFGKRLRELPHKRNEPFVVSRLWRNGLVEIPDANTTLQEGDRVLVITSQTFAEQLELLFGHKEARDWNADEFDWNAIDPKLHSMRIIVTNHTINGRHLGDLQLRNKYGVNITRVLRSGIQLVATPELTLMLGDRLTAVGHEHELSRVAEVLGNEVKNLDEPNLVSIFIGMALGLALGLLPIAIPGMSYPVRLGIAGGPILIGILIGAYGPRFHMATFTTNSANRMLRALGITLYLACLGLSAGPDFMSVALRPEALLWVGSGFIITLVPLIIIAFIAAYWGKYDFATTAGMLCGAMANPIALDYTNSTLPGDRAAVSYATVYPVCMFARVIVAQMLIHTFVALST